METLIELRSISYERGGYAILKDVDLVIPAGRATFILGPAGSGKSTLLKIMAGIIPPDSGDVEINHNSLAAMKDREIEQFRRFAGFVFQDGALWNNMTVLENVMLALRYHAPRFSADYHERISMKMLEAVGYTDSPHSRIYDLSSGEQKLVSLARALVLDPLILFLDSPLSLLDGALARKVTRLCGELKAQNKTLIGVTNTYDIAFQLADWFVILEKGRIRASGPPDSVLTAWPESLEMPTAAQIKGWENRRKDGQ